MKIHNSPIPLVSVIMPAYNAGEFLVESIESILAQTYTTFEFIIVNDASMDNSAEIIKRYAKKDKRIRVITNEKNISLSKSLNKALAIAKGSYIARMDADDIALPSRLEKQIGYMEKNKNLVALGSQCIVIDKNGKNIGKKVFPLSNDEIYNFAFRFNPVQHPTLVVARHRLPLDFVYYDPKLEGAEDLDLIFKLFKYGKVENMNEYLLKYRIHENNVSLKHVKNIFLQAFLSRIKAIFQHHYIPQPIGLITTIIEAVVVLLLPSSLIIKLYNYMRNIHAHKKAIKTKFVSATIKLQSALQ